MKSSEVSRYLSISFGTLMLFVGNDLEISFYYIVFCERLFDVLTLCAGYRQDGRLQSTECLSLTGMFTEKKNVTTF